MNFTIYKQNTGEIIQSGVCQDSDLSLQQIPDECSLLEIGSDPVSQYIKNGQLVNKPAQPAAGYIFNYAAERWEPDLAIIQAEVIAKRNFLLSKSDWTQIPNNPLSAEKQEQWAIYRQSLRDLTQQAGFPLSVQWPAPPA